MRLKQISNRMYGAPAADAFAALLGSSKLIQAFEASSAFEKDATEYDWQNVGGSANLQAFGEGEAISATNEMPTGKTSDKLAFHGDAFTIPFNRQTDAQDGLRSTDVWLQKMRREKHRKFGLAYEAILMNGDPTAKQMKGLSKILNGTDRLPGFTDATKWNDFEAKRVMDATIALPTKLGAKSLDLTDPANNRYFAELWYWATSQVDNPQYVVVSDAAAPRITTIARELNLLTTSQMYDKELPAISGIPILKVPKSVISLIEPDNSATALNETTSFYLISPEEGRFSIMTNYGFHYMTWDHLENIEKNKEQWSLPSQFKIADNKSVLRIRNIKVDNKLG